MNQSPRRPSRPRRLPVVDRHNTQLDRVQTGALLIIAFAVVLFLLVQARFLLISLATAIVLFSLTSDAINFIARQRIGPVRIPNIIASLLALILISTTLLTTTSIILSQINTVLTTTLAYAESAPKAVAAMFSWLGQDVEQAVFKSVSSINVSSYLSTAASQAGNLMSATVLVILFVGFLFAERIWFSTKLVNFVGGDPDQAERIGQVMSTIIHRVNYYLLVKTLVSAVTGGMVYIIAELFKLELSAALGILTFVLNYIPNIGSIVATVLVALVTYVQIGEPAPTAVIFFIVGTIQFVNGSIIDPMLMGRALRLSSFGIIINLAFWGAVWGLPGMFLSVPIMVAMLIICSQVPELRPIAILLSRQGLPETQTEAELKAEKFNHPDIGPEG
ncbi:Transport of quorum-sensing signal protein [Thalassovita gelatinovora]|uniref:Transport of quorum-sensing signal protein n=1 Tax=Thalassovita gelatinovora TaxID=53501 RepID=A0A0P1G7V6_THAGE|nr:AI-2E family transporter [Thalassovita gelatinovora]QIZ79136.1 AI-2E family transporter [Thalassovita gelatinovora]CUH68803.1 Transport of quorum-sensing signal protein [Thalassovita gelatinovora]SEQ59076.1 Predicted PurR-regulated permease PerM [Thalassovita gelatinovora]